MPNSEEIRGWLLETLRHSCQMEYYLDILRLGSRDPDRPHDISGMHNKLEWEIIEGCALAYRVGVPKEEFKETILPRVFNSVRIHRKQYHHQMWNEYNEDATSEDLRVGALDTICALMEKRPYYQKTADSIDEIEQNIDSIITSKNKYVKRQWVSVMVGEMKGIDRPDIYMIENLEGFPNIGLNDSTYNNIAERMQACLNMLKEERGFEIK